jgi:hypothetical protein
LIDISRAQMHGSGHTEQHRLLFIERSQFRQKAEDSIVRLPDLKIE